MKFSIPGSKSLKGTLYIDGVPIKIDETTRYDLYTQRNKKP